MLLKHLIVDWRTNIFDFGDLNNATLKRDLQFQPSLPLLTNKIICFFEPSVPGTSKLLKLYATKKRDGCALCPQAKEIEREAWYKDYPEAVPLLMELQRIVNKHRPENKPLRGNKWFIPEKGLDGYQPTLFDFINE